MAKKRFLIVAILVLGSGGALPLFSESPDISSCHGVYIGINSDSFLGIDFGYSHTFTEKAPGGFRLSAYGTVSLPLPLAISEGTLDTFEFTAGARADAPVRGPFILSGSLELGVLHHADTLGIAVPILISANLMPALRFATWHFGLDLRTTMAAATYLRHSNMVKETFRSITDGDGKSIDSSPVDGWYSPTGFSVRGGIEFAHTPGAHLGYRISTGLAWYPSPYTGMLDAMMIGQIPFYLETGFSYIF